MFCNQCGANVPEGVSVCPNCGKALRPSVQPVFTKEMLTKEFKVLSPWAYFGLQLLFSIPLIGLGFLIYFSIAKNNYNLRAYARSYWCSLLLGLIFAVIILILGISLGGFAALASQIRGLL